MAAPALTESQRAQLAATTDRNELFDRGELYPLLQNAAGWEPGDEGGARVPDWGLFFSQVDGPADPVSGLSPLAQVRGEVYLIEGRVLRFRVLPLNRRGVWGQSVTEWVVGVQPRGGGTNPQDAQPVLVYLVGEVPEVKAGANVRVAARFYKLWREQRGDAAGDYPVFVGGSATVLRGSLKSRGDALPVAGAVMGVVALLLAGLFVVRRYGKNSRMDRPRVRRLRVQSLWSKTTTSRLICLRIQQKR